MQKSVFSAAPVCADEGRACGGTTCSGAGGGGHAAEAAEGTDIVSALTCGRHSKNPTRAKLRLMGASTFHSILAI